MSTLEKSGRGGTLEKSGGTGKSVGRFYRVQIKRLIISKQVSGFEKGFSHLSENRTEAIMKKTFIEEIR